MPPRFVMFTIHEQYSGSGPQKYVPPERLGLWLVAYATGDKAIEPHTALAIYDCAVRAFGIDGTRSVYGAYGSMYPDRPIKQDRREWLQEHLENEYSESNSGEWASLGILGRFRGEPLWHMKYLAQPTLTIRMADNETDSQVPVMSFGLALPESLDDATVMQFCRDSADVLLANERIAYGFIDIVSHWQANGVGRCIDNIASGTWEELVGAHTWKEFLCFSRTHARDLFWGNIFGRDMAARLREAGLQQMLDFNRDFHPRWDAVVVDGPHGGQAVFLDNEPVTFGCKRVVGLICHGAVVQNGAALRAAMLKAGIF